GQAVVLSGLAPQSGAVVVETQDFRTHSEPRMTNATPASNLSRYATFAYGVSSYLLGVAALVWWIVACLGFVPYTGGVVEIGGGTMGAVVFNVGLIALFGIQHTIMARPRFKAWMARFIPDAANRSTFVLVTGLLLGGILWSWQPMDTVVWEITNATMSNVVLGVALVGWTYLFVASFAIDHFELFGLRQVFDHLRGRESSAPEFQKRWMYRFDRHPIMTGALIGLWAIPTMRLDQLVLTAALTAYVAIGVAIEERELIRAHGDSYRDYRSSVRTLVPILPIAR
ncbi:MAG: NnrU family protein, partial [Planctomycetota bacterium]